ncbi:hypothetical protein ACFSOZ_32315 [Mesorhizobium newzealandense]|uniref:Oligopeptide/dipeptide ABC transporter C-terminal domain-containing protein n=1 Tax=Mesorhizobium newzealandense TaxID=1300302 RepID=A0ABW4UJ10_9HYPH
MRAATAPRQRQRRGSDHARSSRTSILLLDEPTRRSTPRWQAEVLNLLEEVRRAPQLTFLMVSHDLAIITHMWSG